jgi:biotin transport system ATP-binding protein
VISVSGVSHRFGELPVLADVSLELTENRIGFIGANGSGKSTLARTFNGLLVPDSGDVTVGGISVRRNAALARRHVGFIFSDADSQIIMPTVAEDIAIGLKRLRLPAQELAARVATALERAGLAAHADHSPYLLSGGQKQMLALAAVLITEPRILICDEPTTLLDLHNVAIFQATLRELDQQVILMTHHLDVLDDFDRVIVMEQGAVYFDGAPAEAIERYRALIAQRPVSGGGFTARTAR